MSVDSLGVTLDRHDEIRLWASRSEEWACLAISGGGASCEIRMDRVHVEALRDQLPDALAGLDRTAADDVACERAEIAGERSVYAAAKALDQALLAEAAGAHVVAAELRKAAAKASATANAVDTAVRAFGNAATDADWAVDSLIYVTREADAALRRLRDDGRPAEPAES